MLKMNSYFDSIIKRCEKIADIILEQDFGKLVVSIDDIRGIVLNEKEHYNQHKWNYIYKKELPINFYGLDEIWVLVKYKTKHGVKPMEVVRYRFDCDHFYTAEGTNVTTNVVAWANIPEEGDC